MLKIGITGNIGSGKSTVAKIFAQLGIPVYDADSRAKKVMVEDKDLILGIKQLLGEDSYLPDGSLNRTLISQKVFSNKSLLEGLNALVHPAVFKDFDQWVLSQHAPYILKEAALLFESGSYQTLDKIIVVAAHENLRLKRSMERDGSNEESVKARMKNQMLEEEKIKLADYRIYNNETDLLIPQVLNIHHQLIGKDS